MNFRKRAIGGWLKNHFRPFGQIVPKVIIARFARFFTQDPFLLPSTVIFSVIVFMRNTSKNHRARFARKNWKKAFSLISQWIALKPCAKAPPGETKKSHHQTSKYRVPPIGNFVLGVTHRQ
jgi:hypothetical protein